MRSRSTSLVTWLLPLLVAPPLAAFEGRVIITLPGALAQYRGSDKPGSEPKPLDLYATCENGQWGDVWGAAMDFNREVHFGRVTEAKVDGDRIRLAVTMDIGKDSWVSGGTGTWVIDLVRQGDTLAGTYSGQFKSTGTLEVKDQPATGVVLPPNPVMKGHVPVAPGEHPRLLFRKADLPRIKERLNSPIGKVVLEKLKASNDPIALGMMFQLTGDRAYAQKAFPLADAQMADRNQGAFALGRAWGYKAASIAMIYDLCYDGWDPEQRERFHAYCDHVVNLCLNRKHRVGTVNWDPGSNYTIAIHPGMGLATLALLYEKGLPPAEPVAPNLEAPRIAPDPALSGPTVDLPIGHTALSWLVAAPVLLHVDSGEDPLAAIGGVAKARPKDGDTFAFRGQKLAWRAISKEQNPDYFLDSRNTGPDTFGAPKNQIIVSTPRLSGREMSRVYLYNIVENKTAGWYRFKANFWQGQCYLNGQRVADGDIVHLDAGRYAWMVPVRLGAPEGHATPWFEAATEEEATKLYADPKRKADYESAVAAYKKAQQAYAADATNQAWLQWARTAEKWSYLCLTMGMGEGGFQAEGESYTLEAHHVVHDYALAFRNVLGRDLTGRPMVSHFAPRYIVTTWFGTSNRGSPQVFNQSYGRGEETIPLQYMARAVGLVPQPPGSRDDWRPALLWFWQRHVGLGGDEPLSDAAAARLLSGKAAETVPLIQALVHYPLDVPPANPATVLPRAWEARTRAFYAFRNGWTGPDDIIAQFYGRTGPGTGWSQPETGSFQIWAFGREMARKINDGAGKTGSRWFDNVVMLPEDPIDARHRGTRVVNAALDAKTGSGAVTVDLADLYQCIKRDGSGKDAKDIRFDGGIRGVRAFAADFSGKGGAPGVFAVLDDITGGKTKQWLFQLPETGRDGTTPWTLETAGNRFTVSWKDGASITGTVVSPAKVTIKRSTGQTLKAHPLSGVADVAPDVLLASGENPADGRFLVVLTVQKSGPGPEVKAGPGLSATVGALRVRYDEQKQVLTLD